MGRFTYVGEAGGSGPPYVLIGASFGGLNAQLCSLMYPQEVTETVLVDLLHPEFDERIEKLFTPEQAANSGSVPAP